MWPQVSKTSGFTSSIRFSWKPPVSDVWGLHLSLKLHIYTWRMRWGYRLEGPWNLWWANGYLSIDWSCTLLRGKVIKDSRILSKLSYFARNLCLISWLSRGYPPVSSIRCWKFDPQSFYIEGHQSEWHTSSRKKVFTYFFILSLLQTLDNYQNNYS